MKIHIFNYLKSASRAVKRPELLSAIRVNANDLKISDRAMRAVIEDMITQDGYCIASSNNGYYIIKTLEEKESAKQYLQEKIESLCIRRNCLERNFKEEIIEKGQGVLF
jgi:hypothetical protein